MIILEVLVLWVIWFLVLLLGTAFFLFWFGLFVYLVDGSVFFLDDVRKGEIGVAVLFVAWMALPLAIIVGNLS
jgi:hypothetical protein